MVMLAYIGKLNIQAHCADYFSVYPHGKKKKKNFFLLHLHTKANLNKFGSRQISCIFVKTKSKSF